ncbi:bis-aminopropyl spermidine synthase family protein [candidate division WWE3 bacterium]|nr:bis-aminopropyl spermidine synthase family protein [candidate division WWE3 bacterium]
MAIKSKSHKIGITSAQLIELLRKIKESKATPRQLVAKTGLSPETLRKFRQEFEELLVPSSGFFAFSAKGLKFVENLKLSEFSFGEKEEGAILRLLGIYEALKPEPKREFDQFYATSETVVKRIRAISELEELSEASILFLGDDDMVSVGLAALHVALRICVVDIDPRHLNFLQEISKKEDLRIEFYHHDLKNPIPAELIRKFDVVFSDPPYTPNGFRLFLHRELEACLGVLASVYICYGTSERSSERLLPIQEIINEYSLAIRYAKEGFNNYTNAVSIGNTSNLYVLRPTAGTPLRRKPSLERIYSYE